MLVRGGDIVVKLERYPSDQSRGGASDAETNESLVSGRDAGSQILGSLAHDSPDKTSMQGSFLFLVRHPHFKSLIA